MSLLREIQQGAVQADTELGTVLRKCLVLSSRLQHDDLMRWAQWELNGYADPAQVPSYRIMDGQVFGTFLGPFGRQMQNTPIPRTSIPSEYRDRLFTIRLLDPIAVYERIAREGGTKDLVSHWPAEVLPIVGSTIIDGMNLMDAWLRATTGTFLGVVETVRNRILSFSLEIESALPNAAYIASPESVLSKSQVTQLFQTYIMGDVANWATGSHFTQFVGGNVNPGDLQALLSAAMTLGIAESELEELKEAVEEAEAPTTKGRFGRKVARWLGSTLAKAAEGAYKVGTEVAADVLAKALNGYYGLR